MEIKNYIHIDFTRGKDIVVPSIQYDSGTRWVMAKLYDNGLPIDLQELKVCIMAVKSDGKEVFNECKIIDAEKGIIEFEITKQMGILVGEVECQIKLFGPDQLLSSNIFKLAVTKTLSPSSESSKDELDVLVNALGQVQDIDNRFAQTNAQLSHKANEVDLITERKRIDSLTKLNDGSTTGDAELIDGRIGCDGITYSNIGSAIRTQINRLKDSLLIENVTFDLEGYINNLGKDESLSGWKKTNYIKVNKGDIVQVNAQGYKTNVSVIHFYNLNQKAIQSLQIGNDKEQTFTQVIPEDGYVRFSGKWTERLHANIFRNNPATVDITSRFNSEFNLGIDYNWTDGSYVNHHNGNLASYEGYSYSDYINVSNLNGAYVYLTEYYQYIGGIAFYDENKKYISGIGLASNTANPNLGQLVEVQLKGHYMRLTCMTSNVCDFKLYTSIKQIIKTINHVNESNSAEILKLNNKIDSEFNLDLSFNWTIGSYIKYTTGEITSFTNDYSYSDFIDISDITGIFMNVTEYYDYVAGIAFYDENKLYISGVGIDNNDNLGQISEIQLKGHYMRLTCRTDSINKFKMYTTIKQIIKSTNRNEEELINPCFYKENPNLIKMFNRIICIGDSYTEGSIEYRNESGEVRQSVASEYSYPTILSKMSGVETVNYGRSGYTSSRWFNEYKNTDLSGFDCAIIFLGINDWYNNGQTLNTEAYSGIINKLRNENRGIPIFCVTITQNYKSSACNLNEQIRQVATENSCYIIDLEKYSDWTQKSSWLNGSHPNSYGYYHNAEMINCYINFIIANNLSEFYNVSFVGTTKIPV